MRTPTLSAADKEVFGNRRSSCLCCCCCWGGQKKQQLWGELLTSREGETEFIRLVIVFAHRTLHKVTLKVKPAGHCCGSDVIWGVRRGYDVDVWLPGFISATLSLKLIQKNSISSWKHESSFFFLLVVELLLKHQNPATGNVDAAQAPWMC